MGHVNKTFSTGLMSFRAQKSLVVVSGWQTKFNVSPGLWSLVLRPFGPDLGPDLDLTWDLDLDLSLTIPRYSLYHNNIDIVGGN